MTLALAALTLHDFDDANAWLPDTGSSAHMVNDAGILSNVHPYLGNTCIVAGNGDILDISHIGDTSLPLSNGSNLPIKDVLVVLGIQKNLLSISQLTTAYPCTCEFCDIGFLILGDVYSLPTKINANFFTQF